MRFPLFLAGLLFFTSVRAEVPATPADDFNFLETTKPDAAALAHQAQVEREIARRRGMLQLHQVLGIATLASLGTTVILGQLNYQDRYLGGGDKGTFYKWHVGFSIGTSALFATTGLLGLLAPVPFEKKLQLDTATLHRSAMALATLGMAAELVLGVTTARHEGFMSQRDFALTHQIIGFTAFGAMAAGFSILFF